MHTLYNILTLSKKIYYDVIVHGVEFQSDSYIVLIYLFLPHEGKCNYISKTTITEVDVLLNVGFEMIELKIHIGKAFRFLLY